MYLKGKREVTAKLSKERKSNNQFGQSNFELDGHLDIKLNQSELLKLFEKTTNTKLQAPIVEYDDNDVDASENESNVRIKLKYSNVQDVNDDFSNKYDVLKESTTGLELNGGEHKHET